MGIHSLHWFEVIADLGWGSIPLILIFYRGHFLTNTLVSAQRARGFTLIEMLVTISIVAVLLAMLLPSLQKAKLQAQKVQCLALLRQTGLLTGLYNNDNRGLFPNESMDARAGLLAYIGTGAPNVFLCPATVGKPRVGWDWDAARVYGGAYYADGSNSYGFNMHLRGYDNYGEWGVWAQWWNSGRGPRMTADRVAAPDATFWMVDATSTRFDVSYQYFLAPYRHGGPANVDDPACQSLEAPGAEGFQSSFVDGHAAWVRWDVWTTWRTTNWPESQPYSWKGSRREW